MIHKNLFINAVPIAPGGGLVVLEGLLNGWRDIGNSYTIYVLASNKKVIDTLSVRQPSIKLIKIKKRCNVSYQIWELTTLPKILHEQKAHLLLTNNFYAPGVSCAQVVHHQQLWSLFAKEYISYLKHGPKRLVQTIKSRAALKYADANIFISQYLYDCAKAICPLSKSMTRVAPNGINKAYLRKVKEQKQKSNALCTICAVQAPSIHKDNNTLLKSFARLRQIFPEAPWRLKIAGHGNWSGLIKMAKKLDIEDHIEIMGYLEQKKLIQLFEGSLCLVYPSYFEGFGLPIIEAMACGCPIVGVNATAIPEIVKNAGILVPPKSPDAIADAVIALFKENVRRSVLTERGKERAVEFQWTKTAKIFLDVFDQVLGGQN